MSRATEMVAAVLEVIEELGATCTIQEVAGVYDTDGTVVETLTSHTLVPCSDLIEDSTRYSPEATDVRCTGIFYVPSSGMTFEPAVGCRVVYDSRTFQVIKSTAYKAEATVIAWRLDVSEVGA